MPGTALVLHCFNDFLRKCPREFMSRGSCESIILEVRNLMSRNKVQVEELRAAGKMARSSPQMAGRIQNEALAQHLERTHDVLSGRLEVLVPRFERFKGLQECIKNSRKGMPVPAQRLGIVAPKVERRWR
jgi:hypothetical protein